MAYSPRRVSSGIRPAQFFRHDFSNLILIPPIFSHQKQFTMKATLLAIALHIILAGVLYATTNPDTLLAKAEFHDRQAYIQIWDGSANVVIDCLTYDLTGDAVTDPYGGVTLLESPTGNAVTIFADGSADVHVGGVLYRFEAE